MKAEELLDAIGELDETVVTEAKTEENEQEYRRRKGIRHRRKQWLRICIPVAAVALIAVLIPIWFSLPKPKSDIPEWVEIQSGSSGDRIFYHTLENVEAEAELIVEVTAKEVDSQECSRFYSATFGKYIHGAGYTRRNCKVTRVYKGDVEEGDILLVLQPYFLWDYKSDDLWDYEETTEEESNLGFMCFSQVKPMMPGAKYLLFIRYDENHGGYYTIGDYEGLYAMPTDEIREKAENKTLRRTDFDYIFQHDVMHSFLPVYYEVYEKYFMK